MVMAIWLLWAIKDIEDRKYNRRDGLPTESREQLRIALPIQEERPHTCPHVRPKLSRY
jgi:hypothetical protein